MRWFSASFATAAVVLPVLQASALPGGAALESRTTPSAIDCEQFTKFIGIYDFNTGDDAFVQGCFDVTEACLKENGTSIWSHQECVAAATCQGTLGVITVNQCQNPNVLASTSIPNLAFTIWTSIVGDCADSGCPMTQQNYIDFIYGAMSAAGTTVWPSSSEYVIQTWWTPMLTWAATGDTIPYSNFNDWLHYSNS
ncbi:hypothetical protein B0H11DRAFT_2201193 [Mycena galericulata]|nr:hypothetical protein B0H11DRAFT_2201193 [Mycena galericulata]